MKKPIRVLVTGGGGDVCRGVVQCLEESQLDLDIFVAGADPHAYILYEERRSFLVPLSASEEYVGTLCNILNKHSVDVLIPTIDSEILKISQCRDRIERLTSARVCVGSNDSVSICDDKLLTAKFLEGHGFPYPISYGKNELTAQRIASLGYPLIAKSRRGGGSKEIWMIERESDLEKALCLDDVMIQERLDIEDNEYTASVYIGKDLEPKGCCIFKRRLRNGSTIYAERVQDVVIENTVIEIARALNMQFLNVQGALSKDREFVPFEFNGRFSGTVAVSARVFNAPELWIRENILGESVGQSTNQEDFIAFREQQVILISRTEFEKRSPVIG